MAVFGHSGSQAPQLMHSLVITVAIEWSSFDLPAGSDAGAAQCAERTPAATQAHECLTFFGVSVKSEARCVASDDPRVLGRRAMRRTPDRPTAVPERQGEAERHHPADRHGEPVQLLAHLVPGLGELDPGLSAREP